MEPSNFQLAIYDFGISGTGNAFVRAVAGSGKTTTIVNLAEMLTETRTKIFLAFNKVIATELQERLPVDVKASTFNSLGFMIYRRNFHCTMNPRKIGDLLKKRGFSHKDQVYWDSIRIMDLLRSNLHIPSQEEIDEFEAAVLAYADAGDLELPPNPGDFFYTLLQESNKVLDEIDFTDQLYLPIVYNMEFPTYQEIFVDECQDLSAVQIEMVRRLAGPDSRVYAVGDERQAIYAFRGADPIALKSLRRIFDLQELPLSVCYRCPRTVVEEAQTIVPQIEPWERAKEGEVIHAPGQPELTALTPDTLTLCRFNAPLFKLGLKLILNNKPCNLQTNLLQSITSLIYSLKAKNTDQLAEKMMDYYQQQKLEFEVKNQYNRLALLEEKKDCVLILCNMTKDKKVSTLIGNLKKLGESSVGPTLSTIHKAKGTEKPHVYYLRDYRKEEFMEEKSPFSVQESNLKYVAITRAQETLTYFDMNQEEY